MGRGRKPLNKNISITPIKDHIKECQEWLNEGCTHIKIHSLVEFLSPEEAKEEKQNE